MAGRRRPPTNERQPPELGADRAVLILEEVLANGKKLLEDPKVSNDAHRAWEFSTRHWLEKAFGHEATEVRDVMHAGPFPEVLREGTPGFAAIRLQERIETLTAQLSRLGSAIGILRMQASFMPPASTAPHEASRMPTPAPLDLFMSQTEKDAPLVRTLLELIEKALKIQSTRIRCTSIPGYKLTGGSDVSATLKYEIKHCVVFLAVLTEASNDSAYVMSEIGARWLAEGPAIILRGGGFTPKQVRGPLADTHSLDLSAETDLHQLVRELAGHLRLQPEPTEAYLSQLRAVVTVASQASARGAPTSPATSPTQPQLSPELEQTMNIMGWLIDHGGAVTTPLVANNLRLSRVETQHLLNTLMQAGLIESSYADGTYSLTIEGTALVAAKRAQGQWR